MKRLKILAIAYACDPSRGSEFGVGWGWVNAIAAEHDITVITADFNAEPIEKHLALCKGVSSDNLRFLYVKNRPWHYRPSGTWLRIESSLAKPVMNLSYQNWLRYAYDLAKRDSAQNCYDVIHLITYVGWRFPGSFYRLRTPFVWGPIGGIENTPWRLLPLLGFKGAIYYGARNLINSLQIATLQGPRRALRAANECVIAATSEIQTELWYRFRAKSRVICEVGPPSFTNVKPKRREPSEPLRICWSGQHVPGKALQLLLRAIVHLPEGANYSIEILGDGPCSQSWRSEALRLKIAGRCFWHGWLPRDRSLEIMKNAHLFVVTSLKDLTSNVAVEAISLGLPVVCLDHCGFADLVTEECGIKVYPGSEKQIVADFARAIKTIYENEPLRWKLAQGAIRRSTDYSWSSKRAALDELYAHATPQRAGR